MMPYVQLSWRLDSVSSDAHHESEAVFTLLNMADHEQTKRSQASAYQQT